MPAHGAHALCGGGGGLLGVQVRRAKERSVVEREGAVLSAERKLRDVQVRAGRLGWLHRCTHVHVRMCMYVVMPCGLELGHAVRGRL